MDEEEDGAVVDPAGWGFGAMLNPAGEAIGTCSSGSLSEPDRTLGKAMLLAAAFSSRWTSGEALACVEEQEQAWGQGGTSWRTEFFYEHPTITNIERIPSSEALVRKDIKYVVWPDYGREQLFDLVKDPQETTDVIADPTYADRLAELRERFGRLKAEAR